MVVDSSKFDHSGCSEQRVSSQHAARVTPVATVAVRGLAKCCAGRRHWATYAHSDSVLVAVTSYGFTGAANANNKALNSTF